jgi:glc operon protein GlcG
MVVCHHTAGNSPEERLAMKGLLTSVLVVLVMLVGAGSLLPSVTYLEHAKVTEALTKGGPLMTAPNVSVAGAARTTPGQVEVHDTETDVLYIVEGEATVVTGGTMLGGKTTGPGQRRGTDIQGGQTQHLTKGDVLVVQAGTPHWFKEVPASGVHYFVVKSIKE